jgi:dihydroflavonol-4-reductase
MNAKVLVTGANGFVASHTIAQLLAKGYDVVGTVRDTSNADVTKHLLALPGADERLRLVGANLLDDDAFDAHMDVDVVMHMASPYVLSVKDPKRSLLNPAVRGTAAVLNAAARSERVTRVIVTSSVAAVTDQPTDEVLTESDWNLKSSLTRNPYHYSKTCAERSAWAFMEEHQPHFKLVVINPFVVIGPALSSSVNTSNQILVDLTNGKVPVLMALTWAFVDVRDVAQAHIAAMATEATGRHLCVSECMPMDAMVTHLRELGYSHTRLPKLDLSGPMGTLLLRLASYAQPAGLGTYLRTHLARQHRFDNSKAINELGVTFRPARESIEDAMTDLCRWGHIEAAP